MISTAQSRRLTIAAVLLIVVGNAAGIVVPAGMGWDFANFYDAGRRVAAGEAANLYDPDSPIAGRPPQGRLGFYGTPLSAYFYAPLAALEARRAAVAFKMQNAAALLLSLSLLFVFHRKLVEPSAAMQWRFAATFAVASLLYQPLWTIYRVGGQTTPTVLLLLALTLVFHCSGRYGRSAAALALAVAIKPALISGLAFLAACSGIGFAVGAAIAGGALAAASVLALGWPVHVVFVERMLAAADLVWPWRYNSSLFVVADNLRRWATGETGVTAVGGGAFGWVTVGLKVAVLVLFVSLMIEARRRDWRRPASDHFRVVTAIAFFLMISQTVWEHYLSFLFPLVTYCLAMRPVFGVGFNRVVVAMVLLSIGQNLVIVNAVSNTFELESLPALLAIGLIKSGPLLGTAVLFTWYRRELLDSYADRAWLAFSTPAPR